MEGQQRLKAARVLCVGTGGLGSPLALYLAAAGIGTLGLVDFDVVDASNLQRQIIHSTKDIGRKKIDSAEEKLKALNPALNVVKHDTMLSSANALDIFKDYDIVADGTDNFPRATWSTTPACCWASPTSTAPSSASRARPASSPPKNGPCYRCLYPEPPPPGLVPSCAEGGVLGILPGLIGMIQATEAIKLILGNGEPLIGRLLLVDALKHALPRAQAAQESRVPGLRHESDRNRAHRLRPVLRHRPPSQRSRESSQLKNGIPQLSVKELKARLDAGEDIPARRPRALRVSDRPDRRQAHPAERRAAAARRDRPQPRDRRPLPQRRRRQRIADPQAARLSRVVNLAGGILAWCDEIDPTVQKY